MRMFRYTCHRSQRTERDNSGRATGSQQTTRPQNSHFLLCNKGLDVAKDWRRTLAIWCSWSQSLSSISCWWMSHLMIQIQDRIFGSFFHAARREDDHDLSPSVDLPTLVPNDWIDWLIDSGFFLSILQQAFLQANCSYFISLCLKESSVWNLEPSFQSTSQTKPILSKQINNNEHHRRSNDQSRWIHHIPFRRFTTRATNGISRGRSASRVWCHSRGDRSSHLFASRCGHCSILILLFFSSKENKTRWW